MTKKAQAGTEFLLTYGWAMLVAAAAIGSLVYIGMLNPEGVEEGVTVEKENSIEASCKIGGGINCLDPRVTGSMIELTIKNQRDIDIAGISITISGEGCSTTNSAGSDSLAIDEEDKYFFECSPEGNFKGEITFNYIDTETSLERSENGEIALG